jgi:hypothetical protein
MEPNNDSPISPNPNIEASYDDTANLIIKPSTDIAAHILIAYDIFPITELEEFTLREEEGFIIIYYLFIYTLIYCK